MKQWHNGGNHPTSTRNFSVGQIGTTHLIKTLEQTNHQLQPTNKKKHPKPWCPTCCFTPPLLHFFKQHQGTLRTLLRWKVGVHVAHPTAHAVQRRKGDLRSGDPRSPRRSQAASLGASQPSPLVKTYPPPSNKGLSNKALRETNRFS